MATKTSNGGSKTSPSKPVAKATAPTLSLALPTPSAPPATPAPANVPAPTPTATSVTYGGSPQSSFQLKTSWKIIGASIIALFVFLCGLALGGVFKKTPSPEAETGEMVRTEVNEKDSAVKINNPKIEFFSGVLECLPGKWTAPVYIKESLAWQAPGGVPYLYQFDENGQAIPCDGITIPHIVEKRVNSVKFKFLIKTVVVIEQVSFKKDTEVEKK